MTLAEAEKELAAAVAAHKQSWDEYVEEVGSPRRGVGLGRLPFLKDQLLETRERYEKALRAAIDAGWKIPAGNVDFA